MADPQTIQPLSDDEILAVANDPQMVAKFTSEERRRLSRLRPAQNVAAPDQATLSRLRGPTPPQSFFDRMQASERQFEGLPPPTGLATTIGPPRANDPISFADMMDNPRAALGRMGDRVVSAASDPQTYLQLLAMFAVPRVIGAIMPGRVGGAATPAPTRQAPPAVSPFMEGVKAGAPELVHGMVPQSVRSVMAAVRRGVAAAREAKAAPAPEASTPPPASPPTPSAGPSPAPNRAAAPQSPPAANPHLTAEEFAAAQKLVAEGYDPKDVLLAIQRNRLPEAWRGLPSDADVQKNVSDRNTTGRWPE